jgi:hypothetical protein
MLMHWAKRIGSGLIFIGITVGLVGAIPLLSPQQDGSAPPDYKVEIIALALVVGGVVLLALARVFAGFLPDDDFEQL